MRQKETDGKLLAPITKKLNTEEKKKFTGLPCGSVVKNRPTSAGDEDSIPDLGRSHLPQSNEARGPQ